MQNRDVLFPIKVALVESSPSEQALRRSQLEKGPHRVQVYDSIDDGTTAMKNCRVDVCVASLEWPQRRPEEICRKWRADGILTPIIGLVNAFEDGRCVAALRAGADDVVRRDISDRELNARIGALLRRSLTPEQRVTYADRALSFSAEEMRVKLNEELIALSVGESRILTALIEIPGRVISIERLRLNGQELIPEATIRAQLRSLRQKLGSERIQTRIGMGYAYAEIP